MNYAGINGNDAWKNDYLWLPSLTETGYDNDSHIGMWKTTTNQRKLINSDTGDSDLGNVGSANSTGGTYNNSWLRTTYHYRATGGRVYGLKASGSGYSLDRYTSYSSAVRPALHLNLTAIANSLK